MDAPRRTTTNHTHGQSPDAPAGRRCHRRWRHRSRDGADRARRPRRHDNPGPTGHARHLRIPLRTLTEVPPPLPPPTGPNPLPIPYPVVATVNSNPQRTTTAPTDQLPVVTGSKHG